MGRWQTYWESYDLRRSGFCKSLQSSMTDSPNRNNPRWSNHSPSITVASAIRPAHAAKITLFREATLQCILAPSLSELRLHAITSSLFDVLKISIRASKIGSNLQVLEVKASSENTGLCNLLCMLTGLKQLTITQSSQPCCEALLLALRPRQVLHDSTDPDHPATGVPADPTSSALCPRLIALALDELSVSSQILMRTVQSRVEKPKPTDLDGQQDDGPPWFTPLEHISLRNVSFADEPNNLDWFEEMKRKDLLDS